MIDNLHVEVEGKKILKGFSLTITRGKIHAIMGPNGAGKSTLAKVIAGHEGYTVTGGDIRIGNESILELDPAERAKKGLFMSFQYPVEIPGVSNREFLHASYSALHGSVDTNTFDTVVQKAMADLKIIPDFLDRDVNGGFSGGEKKRNEILQMALAKPSFAILDETDSGLDIDAMKIVAQGVNSQMNPEMGLLLITHYQRLLDYIEPDFVHVVMDGKVVQTGTKKLAKQLEANGYDAIEEALCQHS